MELVPHSSVPHNTSRPHPDGLSSPIQAEHRGQPPGLWLPGPAPASFWNRRALTPAGSIADIRMAAPAPGPSVARCWLLLLYPAISLFETDGTGIRTRGGRTITHFLLGDTGLRAADGSRGWRRQGRPGHQHKGLLCWHHPDRAPDTAALTGASSPFQPCAASPAAEGSGASGTLGAAAAAGSSAVQPSGLCPRPRPAGCAAPACQLPVSCLLLQWLRNGGGSPLVGTHQKDCC